MALDLSIIRAAFPALDSETIFFDNPGGTQVPQQVVDRVNDYLLTKNANLGGAFATSKASDRIVTEGRQAMADFLNAERSEEIIFGPNMTTLTLAFSRAFAQTLSSGDEIVVTRLDHDANIAPWLQIAEDRGCTVRWTDFDVEDCTLRLDHLEANLNDRTRLVAVGLASNAVGTVNPVRKIAELAHTSGALCFVDAVQYAPHGPIDVQDLDCDFLVVSGYKIYGPHIGSLYGKYEHLERLQPYKVRPAPDDPPGKFETGTKNHEGIAGMHGALEYLAHLGQQFGAEFEERYLGDFEGRRLQLKKSQASIRAYELELSRLLLETLENIPGLRVWGITDPMLLDRRVPTVAFTIDGQRPRHIAEVLGEEGINVWDGNYYALAVTERLGLEEHGGMVRVGLSHYNVDEEIVAMGEVLKKHWG